MENVFDITDFGAKGDGITDCTSSIQAAVDKAADVHGAVIVPPGNYICGKIIMRERIKLQGLHSWAYRKPGASILTLSNESDDCLIDISDAPGCTISELSLEGNKKGNNIHGIKLYHAEYNGGGTEDTPTVEDCKIDGFSGDGIHLEHIWCFSVRHCMIGHCFGNGLFIDGWDGFIIDNWFSGNKKAGIGGGKTVNSVTATGNRIEWNGRAGVYITNGNTMNFTGNYFDRSGGPALAFVASENEIIDTVSASGNIFYRNGAACSDESRDRYDSCHIRAERCVNFTFTGNAFRAGKDDDGKGFESPEYVLVANNVKDCTFFGNAMSCGALKQNIIDIGGNSENLIAEGNVGEPSNGGNIFPHF